MSELEKAKPGVEIELGGIGYRLLFDFYALSLIDEEIGLDFLNQSSGERMSLKKLIVLVWAGLVHADETLEGRTKKERARKIREVANRIGSTGNVAELTSKVSLALAQAFPAQEKGSPNDDAGESPEESLT